MLGKLGDTPRALESVHEALSEALVAGHPATAAAAYQAVAIVHENAGELGQAIEAYEVAIDYCASTGIAARRPSARPASVTCSGSAASGAAAWRSAGR